MPNQFRNIDDEMNLDKYSERWSKPTDFIGLTLILKSASLRTGTRGEYYVIGVTVEMNGEEYFISTGASQPMMVLQTWIASGSKPVRFTFTRQGDRVLISKPED